MIQINNLSKSYGKTPVLQQINLTIHDHDVFGIVGTSGVGKSTLLNCIAGLEQYESGSIEMDGVKLETLQEKEFRNFRKNIGVVFQQFSLLSRKTVYQNIALPMECWHVSKEEQREKIHRIAELVGIPDKLNVRPDKLSGGQKQRVAIARALVMNPKYLLCDEFTSALDPKTTNSILDLLEQIRNELKITIVVVTHEMPVVQKICRNMAIIENGQIAQVGEVKDLFLNHPVELQRLLGNTATNKKNGCYITLQVPESETEVVWKLARITQKPFSIDNVESYKFCNSDCYKFAIAVDECDLERCCVFLNQANNSYIVNRNG